MALDDPGPVVGFLERVKGQAQLLDGLKAPHPEKVLLQGPDEPFDTAVALGLAHESRRARDAEEGELALVSLPGTSVEKFVFTVRDDAVAANINKVMGQRVSLHYEEKVGLPTSCFGDTRYYVTGVSAMAEVPLAPGVVVPKTPGAPASPSPAAPPAPPAPPASVASPAPTASAP